MVEMVVPVPVVAQCKGNHALKSCGVEMDWLPVGWDLVKLLGMLVDGQFTAAELNAVNECPCDNRGAKECNCFQCSLHGVLS